jgi:fucose permease
LKQFRFAFVFALWSMVLYGAIDAMRSATGPLLQAQMNLSYGQLGLLFSANSIGYLAGSFPSGIVLHRVGLKRTVFYGSLGMGVLLVAVPFARLYTLLWFAFFFYGAAMGWLEIGVNAVIPAVANSAREESAGFNLLHGFYGVGATIFPTLVIWLAMRSGSWGTPFIVVGAVAILAVVSIFRYRFPRMAQEQDLSPAKNDAQTETRAREQKAFSSPLLYALVLSIMLYVVAEGGTAAWLPTYLVHAHSMSVTKSSWYLTGFYFIFTLGRLSGPLWVHRLGSYGSIVWSSVYSLVFFVAALIIPHGAVLFIVSALGFSVTFPVIVHIVSQAFVGETGRVLGMLFTCAGIGGIFVSWLIGYIANIMDIKVAFWLIPIALLLVLITIVIARSIDRRSSFVASASVPPANL